VELGALRRRPSAGNTDFAQGCERYADLLLDGSSFSSVTTEELLEADVLPPQTADALHERYIAD
jgi:hypothetical protein